MDYVIVALCVLVVLLGVTLTAWLHRLDRRLAALEDEVGVTWAEHRLEKTLIKRVMTIEILRALRRRPR